MTDDPVEQLATALAATEQLVAGVRPDQWTAPTPCSEWNVRDLVGHLVYGNFLFASILRGEAPPARDAAIETGGDMLTAYRQSSTAVLEAFRLPGVLQRMVAIPAGSVPGAAAAHIRIVEALVHGWDLAHATGQIAAFPDSLVDQELVFTRAMLPQVQSGGRRPFAPEQSVDDGAAPIDRLAALLGRRA